MNKGKNSRAALLKLQEGAATVSSIHLGCGAAAGLVFGVWLRKTAVSGNSPQCNDFAAR
jgi:hypothetical protein